MNNQPIHPSKLLIAGGGTGGHVFPGIAVAEEWKRRGGEVHFVGTRAGKEAESVPQAGFPITFIEVGRLKGMSLWKKIKTVCGLPLAIMRAICLVRREAPSVVLGIGGYAAGPACLAGRLMGKYTAIQDRDLPAGLTNRILGHVVHRVFTTFEKSAAFFPQGKARLVGNPVRAQIGYQNYQSPQGVLRVLIVGGSLGAVPLNEKVTETFDKILSLWPQLKVWHQAGKTDELSLKQFYKSRKIDATIARFFSDMPERYAEAHVVICRSGSGTLAELAMSGRPSILVPYPYAADDHQWQNACVFEEAGAAWVFRQEKLSGEAMASLLKSFLKDPKILLKKAERAHALARPNAAKDIVDELLCIKN